MRNKIIIFIIIVLSIILIPKVYATNDFNGLPLSLGNKVVGYNWSSSTTYTSLPIYSAGENYEEYVYYATTNTVSTGTYGISFAVTMDNMMLANHYYRLVYVVTNGMENACGTPSSWANQLRFSYTATNSMTNLVTYERSGTNIGNSLELGYTNPVKACTYFHIIKPSQNTIFMNLPVNSSSSINTMWHFYGYYIEDLGDADSLTASDLENSISDLQNTLTQNYNTNTQNIINNQNTNAQQAHNDAVNTQNTIKDDNVDSPNSSINTIKNYLATNGVITNLVTLPVTLYQSILNSVNSSCSTFSLGSLYGTNLQIPCINVSNYIGNTLWGTIDVIISGIFVYSISRKMVKVFNQLSSMKEGDVLDG